MKPVEVRGQLVEALRLDLVGPDNGSGLEAEVLSQAPSCWYLTGFLVPLEADPAQKSDDTAQDEFDFEGGESDAGDDDTIPETPAARRAFFPSSNGLSLLVPETTRRLKVIVQWGDYRPEAPELESTRVKSPLPMPCRGAYSTGIAVLAALRWTLTSRPRQTWRKRRRSRAARACVWQFRCVR